jgi:hypothetical protein
LQIDFESGLKTFFVTLQIIEMNLEYVGVKAFRRKVVKVKGYFEVRGSHFCTASKNVGIGYIYLLLKLDDLSIFLLISLDNRRIGKRKGQ